MVWAPLICARNITDLIALRKALLEQNPDLQILAFQADMAVQEDTQAFAAAVSDMKIPVSVLVNNCGIYLPGEVHSEPDGTLDKLIRTNLFSAYDLTRALIGPMKAINKGHIINICSTASVKPYPNGGSYAITKFALYGFSLALREELKPHGIRVTAILPGPTLTDSWNGTDLPESRFMKSSDIAQGVWAAYQLSDYTVVEEMTLRPQLGDI